jgi:hypothetical protein
MIAIGTIGSLGSGASFPVMLLFFSDIIDTFTGFGSIGCDFNGTAYDRYIIYYSYINMSFNL